MRAINQNREQTGLAVCLLINYFRGEFVRCPVNEELPPRFRFCVRVFFSSSRVSLALLLYVIVSLPVLFVGCCACRRHAYTSNAAAQARSRRYAHVITRIYSR